MKHLFSAGIITFRTHDAERQYLLLHYPHGHWDLPKGKIEIGESRHQAALRELKEETGLEATILGGFEEEITYFFRESNDELLCKTVYFFVGQTESDAVTLSDEHVEYEWLPYDEAVERLTFDNAKEVLHKAHGFLDRK